MTQTHEILHLNPSRIYIRVGETWYDSRADFGHKIGDPFLIGRVEEILSYEEYTDLFPESTTELYERVSEKTNTGGYIRKASYVTKDGGGYESLVEYAVNPQQFIIEGNAFDIAE
jgi:hypothetical protein